MVNLKNNWIRLMLALSIVAFMAFFLAATNTWHKAKPKPIVELRTQHPQYNSLSDREFINLMYLQNYPNMGLHEFYVKTGYISNNHNNNAAIVTKPEVTPDEARNELNRRGEIKQRAIALRNKRITFSAIHIAAIGSILALIFNGFYQHCITLQLGRRKNEMSCYVSYRVINTLYYTLLLFSTTITLSFIYVGSAAGAPLTEVTSWCLLFFVACYIIENLIKEAMLYIFLEKPFSLSFITRLLKVKTPKELGNEAKAG